MARILILEDEPSFLKLICTVFQKRGHECLGIDRLAALEGAFLTFMPEVVLLDIHLPDGNSLDSIHLLKTISDTSQIIVITGMPDDEGAQRAFNMGAWDYICKTDPINRITLAIERAAAYRIELKAAVSQAKLRATGIIGNSGQLKKCMAESALAAHSDAPILITGETGTGKGLLARAIHLSSDRSRGEFVVVDCASIPSQLAESILFGHLKGAFTGADSNQQGLVKVANGGTLFLDEVAEMPEEVQKRFLRVVQEKIFRPVGATKEEYSNFRVIAATNKDLHKLAGEGKFREDLLHRLTSIGIHLPPLREREGDIRLIAESLVNQLIAGTGVETKALSPDYIDALEAYSWPGNVRELAQAVEASLTNSSGFSTLYAVHLPERVRMKHFHEKPAAGTPEVQHQPMKQLRTFGEMRESILRSFEKSYLSELMTSVNGDVKLACEISGLGRSRLYGLLKDHSLSTLGQAGRE